MNKTNQQIRRINSEGKLETNLFEINYPEKMRAFSENNLSHLIQGRIAYTPSDIEAKRQLNKIVDNPQIKPVVTLSSILVEDIIIREKPRIIIENSINQQ